MDEQKLKIILTGYANDLDDLTKLIAPSSMDIIRIDENALGPSGQAAVDVPPVADVTVFVLSIDACYSTRLRGIFVYVYDHVSAPRKYLLALEQMDLSKLTFPEIAHLPAISITELKKLLDTMSSG
jgi:hypothetical protein